MARDFDLDAAAAAKSGNRTTAEARCGSCGRPIYMQPVYPGVPSEWRHRSSSHAVSWTPEKHLASRTTVFPHAHVWAGVNQHKKRCTVDGCDSELLAVPKPPQAPVRSAKEQKDHEQRQRGHKSLQKTKATGHSRIPF